MGGRETGMDCAKKEGDERASHHSSLSREPGKLSRLAPPGVAPVAPKVVTVRVTVTTISSQVAFVSA